MTTFKFHIPTSIKFGEGCVHELNSLIDENIQRILIVTDHVISTKTDIVDTLKATLGHRDLFLFDDVEENPSFKTLARGKEFAQKVDAQLVIGLGGGSPMDAAKGIAVLATNNSEMRDYMDGMPLSDDPLPIVCIPTTSGTGSEVTPFAVFTDKEDKSKGGFSHPKIFPSISIIDPEMTWSMPESVIINTGLDALTHAIEAYLSLESSPMSDMYSLESIRLILDHLAPAAKKDHSAMAEMAYASMLAGVAITHASTILLHIMGYPLTVFHAIPHGLANAILLPQFMNFMRGSSSALDKVERLDQMFATCGGIRSFVEKLGVSTKLSDYGVRKDDLRKFAEKVIVKGDVEITPAKLSRQIIEEIFISAL